MEQLTGLISEYISKRLSANELERELLLLIKNINNLVGISNLGNIFSRINNE